LAGRFSRRPKAKLPVKEWEQLLRRAEVNADQWHVGPRYRTAGADIKDGPPDPIRPHIELHRVSAFHPSRASQAFQ
jgi:hypothetical protein